MIITHHLPFRQQYEQKKIENEKIKKTKKIKKQKKKKRKRIKEA